MANIHSNFSDAKSLVNLDLEDKSATFAPFSG